MANLGTVSYGTNVQAVSTKAVRYEGQSVLREGMPVCYNFDTTTNVNGVNKATMLPGATTAEGYQNEGKYLLVEDPVTANLQWFAGVVKSGAWCGRAGPADIEIYEANGAIVPVRAYISATVGKSAMAIMNGQTYFGNPNAGMTNGAARFVAVAEETVNRSDVAGICLARLCPSEFLYQSHGALKLEFVTVATIDVAANFINVRSAQASGGFTAMWVRSEVDTAGNEDTALALYGEANLLGVGSSPWICGNRFAINLWGGTQTAGLICGLMAEVYEEGANLSGGGILAPFAIHDMVDSTNGPAANAHWLMYVKVSGGDKPDGLLYAASADSVGYATTSNGTAMAHIPIYIAGVGTRYILLEDTA